MGTIRYCGNVSGTLAGVQILAGHLYGVDVLQEHFTCILTYNPSGSRSSFRPSATPSTKGADPTKRRSRSEPRSSSESEQEHHDPREVRAPTAEQITVAAEQVRPAHGAHGSGTARRSELTQSGRTETERAAHHSSGETCAPIQGGGYISPSSLQ